MRTHNRPAVVSRLALTLIPLSLHAQQAVPLTSASAVPPEERRAATMEAVKHLNEAWTEFLTGSGSHARTLVDPWLAAARPKVMLPQEVKAMTSGPEFQEPDVVKSANGKLTVTLAVAYADNKIGKDPVRLRNYNGKLTGPTLLCQPGDTLYITVDNRLEPEPYMPGAMDTLHSFNTTNLHTHGLHVSPRGNSDNVLLQVGPQSVQRYEIAIPKDHPCGTFWYHAHQHGSTAANVGSGMSGALIIQGGIDNLPGLNGIKERIMVLQQIPYINAQDAKVCSGLDDQAAKTIPKLKMGVIEAEYESCIFPPGSWDKLGRYVTINGQKIPVIRMKPGSIERWRMIDSALREPIYPSLEAQQKSDPAAPDSIPLQEIAVDGLPTGRIATPKQLELWPGYRSDVLVQAPSNAAGSVYVLQDNRKFATTPATADRKFLAIVVIEGDVVSQTMPNPADLAPFKLKTIDPGEVTGRQFAAYGIIINKQGNVDFTVDRQTFGTDEARQINIGDVEEWSLTSHNSGTGNPVSHPFHIHVNPFEIYSITDAMGNEQLDIDPTTNKPITVWRDTVILNEGWKVLARTRYTDYDGVFVQHCHILDHEDSGMMELVQINGGATPALAMNEPAPLRPYVAPDWRLPDEKGRTRSLTDLATGPSLLVFFEGFSCLRCNEQIQQLITQNDAFKKAGVRVIAISTDTIESLAGSLADVPCPFPMFADPSLGAFRAYGCTVGKDPMHGMFLLDEKGIVRWQAVTTKPYTDWTRVFAEARKLKPITTAGTSGQTSDRVAVRE